MARADPGPRELGIIGRTLRLMLAMLLGWMVFTVMRSEYSTFRLWVVGLSLGVLVFHLGVHFAVRLWGARLHPWSGSVLVLVPLALLFALGGLPGRHAVALYLAASYLVEAVWGQGACEVLALPSLLVRRNTHLMGILFAPVDLVEKHLTGPGGLPG
jgi:hypothetical protein